jgi:hypothetical protein
MLRGRRRREVRKIDDEKGDDQYECDDGLYYHTGRMLDLEPFSRICLSRAQLFLQHPVGTSECSGSCMPQSLCQATLLLCTTQRDLCLSVSDCLLNKRPAASELL